MLACLQQPAPKLTVQADGEQRTERVSAAELQRLPHLLQSTADDALSLDDGLQAECFAVLVDLAQQGDATTRTNAAQLLARDFAPDADAALDGATAELWACTQAAIRGDAEADARLADLCRSIAAGALATPAASGPHAAAP